MEVFIYRETQNSNFQRCRSAKAGQTNRALERPTELLSQGDLILCSACEAFRFPWIKSTKNKGKDKTVTTRQSIRTRGPGNQHIMTSESGKTSSTSSDLDASNTPAQHTATSESTTSDRTSSDKGTSSVLAFDGNSSTGPTDFCPRCHEPVDSKCITCDICHDVFHAICTGLPTEVFNTLISIVSDAGWVCTECRTVGQSKITALQSSLTRTNEELSVIRTLVSGLKGEIDQMKSDVSVKFPDHINPTLQMNAVKHTATVSSTPAVEKIAPDEVKIRAVVRDINRRKCNVVISGLPEPAVDDDEADKRIADCETVTGIFEAHLDVKPPLSHLGCVRLGKLESHVRRPRKLLVHLTSETAASSVLNSARLLRRCDDPVIASNVFINPDLSPIDAKLAYEKRQLKRERKNRGGFTQSQSQSHSSTHDNDNKENTVTVPLADIHCSSSATSDTIPTPAAASSSNTRPFQ